jgi:hypothetical protein
MRLHTLRGMKAEDILGLLSSISTSISDLNCDSFRMLINLICGLNISSKQFAC